MLNQYFNEEYKITADLLYIAHPIEQYLVFERYLNDGSPSGFSQINDVSKKYSAFSPNEYFNIPVKYIKRENATLIGELPKPFIEPFQDGHLPILMHPDYINRADNSGIIFSEFSDRYTHTLKVSPTSSGRTVFNKQYEFFVKLHYPYCLGRFLRDIPLFKWLSSLEISKELDFQKNNFPKSLSFLKEYSGIFLEINDNGFGTIFRDFHPTPLIRSNNTLLIPAFSLFYNLKNTTPLLIKLLSFTSVNLSQFLNLFAEPILESYIFLSCENGLIPEFNSQNVLFEYNFDNNTTRIVVRDMMDIFKDIPLRKSKKLDVSLCSYHNLYKEEEDYYKRRSFAFDFKCSQYLLKPLIKCFCHYSNSSVQNVIDCVTELSKSYWANYPNYFNCLDKWYAYPDEINVNRNTYIELRKPLFR